MPIAEPKRREEPRPERGALVVVRRLVGIMLADTHPALGVECMALVTGIGYEASQSDVARRHDVTRATVSRRCADLADMIGCESDKPTRVVIRRLVGILLADNYPAMGIECMALATGLCYEGSSMAEIAKRHYSTRAAVSARCVGLCEVFGIPPVRAMRSKNNRAICAKSRTDNLKEKNDTSNDPYR